MQACFFKDCSRQGYRWGKSKVRVYYCREHYSLMIRELKGITDKTQTALGAPNSNEKVGMTEIQEFRSGGDFK